MIDLHAHVLPGVDDGPVDLEGSVALARAAVAAGTTRLAATSHVNHDFGRDVTALAPLRARTQAAIDDAGIGLELLAGGELALTRAADLSADELRLITLGDGGTLLLEPPFITAGPMLENAVFALQTRGFAILLAHPERSPDVAQRFDELLELVRRGVRLQLTASSLTGAFGRPAQELALELLHRGAVHVIASDAHGADSRTPDVGKHLDVLAASLPEVADEREWWTHEAPAAIVAGRPVGRPPVIARPRRFGRISFRGRRGRRAGSAAGA